MILVLKKVWAWLKRNWKWILFPVGLLMFIGGIIIAVKSRDTDTPPPPDFGDEVDTLRDRITAANAERDRKLEELRQKNHERLTQLSGDQQKELEELKDKPLEEVVAWFDQL
jgi:hypothetical protein